MDKQEVLKEYRKTEDRILLSQVLDKIEIAEKRNPAVVIPQSLLPQEKNRGQLEERRPL